jgi:hypothetical protein
MTKRDRLWQELTRRTPKLLDDPHFTTESVEKFFVRVYDAGWRDGITNSKGLAGTSSDIFSQVFGSR